MRYFQKIYDNTAGWCFYTLPSETASPGVTQTTPNHTNNLVAASHTVIRIFTDGAVYTSASDPLITNDSSLGHFTGQTWVNTSTYRVWTCVDASAGTWKRSGGPPAAFASDAGTVALYTFNGNANDSSGNTLNLAPAGSPRYSYGFGTRRAALLPPGGSSYSLTSATLNLTSDLCIEALWWPRPGGSFQTLIQYGPNASRRYYIQQASTSSSEIRCGYWNGSAHIELTDVPILFEQWNLLHLVRDVVGGDITLTLYVNGMQAATRTDTATVSSASDTFYVARNATGSSSENLNYGMVGGIHLSTSIPTLAQIRYRAQLYLPDAELGA